MTAAYSSQVARADEADATAGDHRTTLNDDTSLLPSENVLDAQQSLQNADD
jgi:hypothetical protein